MTILRSMQDNFDYARFRSALTEQGFNKAQSAMLKLRLSLLDSCLEGGTETNSVASHFKKGQLTIIEYALSPSSESIPPVHNIIQVYRRHLWMDLLHADSLT